MRMETRGTTAINSNEAEKETGSGGDVEMLYNVRWINDHRMTDRAAETLLFDVANV